MLSSWWERIFRREPPLVRTPSTGRPRTYSADSGYVYQYTFDGFRRGRSQVEYVFEVATGRAAPISVRLILTDENLRQTVARERELTASERYGIAKLALKRTLDATDHPGDLQGDILVDPVELEAIGEILDL